MFEAVPSLRTVTLAVEVLPTLWERIRSFRNSGRVWEPPPAV